MSGFDIKKGALDETPLISRFGCISLSLLFAAGAYLFVGGERRALRPITDSSAYVWPEGCPPFQYSDEKMDNIPLACLRDNYQIKDWRDRGLPEGGSKNRPAQGSFYYRIGNDAVAVSCSIDGSKCWSRHVRPNFFK